MSAGPPQQAEVVVDLTLSSDDEEPQQANSGRQAGETPRPREAAPRPVPRQRGRRQRPAGAGDNEVVDISSPASEVQVVSSTVQPAAPRSAKRPRPPAAPPLSPTKQRLLQQLLNPPQPLPLPPSAPEAACPKCPVCFEPMGSTTERHMAAGPCGHVHCEECLRAAVKVQKKCPTCRKTIQQRQIHTIYMNYD